MVPWVPNAVVGSSPQMRGAPSCAYSEIPCRGIIPADAGSTNDSHNFPRPRQDHPRRCGEHDRPRTSDNFDEGSSPQMRGAQSVG